MSQEDKNFFNRLDDFYSKEIEPYQSLIETIALQNLVLHQLQEKNDELQKTYAQLKEQNKGKKEEQYLIDARKKDLKDQLNIFLEQALTMKQQQYEQEFEAKKGELLEEIYFKYHQLCQVRFSNQQQTNIFMHLDDQLFKSSQPVNNSNASQEANQK